MTSVQPKNLGLVIPIFNMADSLAELMSSIEASRLLPALNEVVIVNDGSTDDIEQVFEKARATSSEKEKWTLLTLNQNQGRFIARYRGAEIIKTDLVLFLDARISLHLDFAAQISEALKTHECLVAAAQVDESKGLFDLYWARTHRWAFKKYYRELEQKGLWLTPQNYDQYLKGTGAFVCPRKLFMECCSPYLGLGLHSDDTQLLKDISAKTPIHIPSYLKTYWHPRRELKGFLYRLFERGPGFVEYHVFHRRGLYFVLFSFSVFLFVFNLSLFLIDVDLALAMFFALSLLLALSTILFSQNFNEALRLAPLHYLSIVSYFFGALWGIFVVVFKKLKSSDSTSKAESPL